MDFTGKVVIVTGASSGIGACSALLFAQYGAKLTVIGRNQEKLFNVAQKCKDARGNIPLCLVLDLTENGSCEKIVSSTLKTFGQIDVLVNSAGKFGLGSLFDETIDAFDEMLNINLRVPYKLTHQCLPHLLKRKGNVVNLAASNEARYKPGFLPHSIAKAALIKFSNMAAYELAGEGVRINSVNPGLTRTNILSNLALSEQEIKYVYEGISKNNFQILEPEEVAKMVVFVASGLCPNINGSEMRIDAATRML